MRRLALGWGLGVIITSAALYIWSTEYFTWLTDRAQRAFEQDYDWEQGRGYDWDKRRSQGKLTCRATKLDIRICELDSERVHPLTGEKRDVVEIFVCSPKGCAWVTP